MAKLNWYQAAVVALLTTSQLALGAVESREYKVLLKPASFQTSPVDVANKFLADLKSSLTAKGFDSTIQGSFAASKDRTVFFYDTAGNCSVKSASYSMRERVEDGSRKIELKFGSPNETISANKDVSGASSKSKTKFEDDITPPAKETFSKSTSQPLSSSKNINKLKDIKDLYPTTTAFDSISSQALVKVSNLTIHELTFEGPFSDLGQQEADFTMTVWYPNGAKAPGLAEISFDVAANSDGVFTDKVTKRSQLIFNTIQNMTNWTQTPSSTKTIWVYQYQPSFCSTKN